eukprot:TRINITY_DN12653_c0_g1_i1.p1 TRINITY_DN12653_c0_g1~~TRINITY_DN12653_c0_g1_i1.p1  ORF type:complete len:220 (-),score=39.47 TRINITY_DN12653_c0_g1_i1:51-710(-)
MEGFREPCPYRIITELGAGFAMGTVGGCVYYFVQGMRQPVAAPGLGTITPRKPDDLQGLKRLEQQARESRGKPKKESRFRNGLKSARTKGPGTGGGFALWAGFFSVYDCLLGALRGREDAFNAIAAGGLTGATVAIRSGLSAIGTGFIGGAVFLAIIEGVMYTMQKRAAAPIAPTQEEMEQTILDEESDSMMGFGKLWDNIKSISPFKARRKIVDDDDD